MPDQVPIVSGVMVERRPVPGTCPRCGAEALSEYPVLSEGGWFEAVKCQSCLHSVTRQAWHRLGWVERAEPLR